MEEEHRKKISESMIGNKNGIGNRGNLGRSSWNRNKKLTKEHKERISQTMKTKKLSGQFEKGRDNYAIINMKGKTYEEIYGKEKAKQIIERMKKNPAQCNSATINLKGRTYEDIYGPEKAKEQKEKRRMKTKEKYANGTATFGFPTDGTMKLRRAKQIFPIKNTKIEEKIQSYLQLLGIEFYDHYYTSEITNAYQCDISIPIQRLIQHKTIIECDGDWWHGNPIKYPIPNEKQKRQIENDKIRTQQLEEKGFRVIRLWETDINQLNLEDFAKICYGIK